MSLEPLTVRQLRNARQIPTREDAADAVASLPRLALKACCRALALVLARLINLAIDSVIS